MAIAAWLTVSVAVLTLLDQSPSGPGQFPALALPPAALSSSCTLVLVPVPVPTPTSAGRRVQRVGDPLLTTNPRETTDPAVMASVWERMGGPLPLADGPPMSGRAAASYRLRAVEDVTAAYAAHYRRGSDETMVYALRFTTAAAAESGALALAAGRSGATLRLGDTVIAVRGARGCADAITAHLTSLRR